MVIGIAGYILINLLVFGSWFLFLRWRYQLKSIIGVLLAFVFGHTQILIISMLLGLVFNQLYPLELSLLNLLCSVLLLTQSGIKYKALSSIKKRIRCFDLRSLNLPIITIPFLIVGLVSIINLLVLIFFQPTNSWDDYNYHLGFVADIIKTGQIRVFADASLYTIAYPHNIEIFNLWHVIFIRNDSLVELTNFSFLFMAGICVYAIARHFNVGRRWALIASQIIFTTPILLLTAKTTKVDISIWALFILGMYFLLKVNFREIELTRNRILLLGTAAAAGLIFGAKTSGILYAAILFLVSVYLLYASKGKFFIKKLLIFGAGFFLALLILGSFWYFRSWYVYGNPIYPVKINIFGIDLPGTIQAEDFTNGLPQIQNRDFISRFLYTWEERESWFGVFYLADAKLTGNGPLWFTVLLPCYIAALCYGIYERNKKILIFMLASLMLFLLLPGNWIPHYTGFIILTGCVAFAVTIQYIFTNKYLRIIVLIMTLAMHTASMFMLLNGSTFPKQMTIQRIRDTKGTANTYKFANFNIFLNNNGIEDELVLTTSKVWFPYALYEADYSNNVLHLPYNHESITEWMEKVRTINPDYVVVNSLSPEYVFFIDNPEFKLLLEDNDGPHYLYSYDEK